MFSKLGRSIYFPVMLIAVALILFIDAFAIIMFADTVEDAYTGSGQSRAARALDLCTLYINSVSANTYNLAADEEIIAELENPTGRTIISKLDAVCNYTLKVDGVCIYSKSGAVYTSSEMAEPPTLDELKRSEGIAQFAEDDSQAYVSLRTENIADIYHNVSYPDELGVVTCCRKIYGESGDVVGLIFADILPSNLYDYALSGSAFDGATVFISSGNFFFGYGGNEQSEELLTGGGNYFRFEASSDELPLTVTVFDDKGEYNAMVWTLTGALGGVSVMLIIGVHFAAKRTATAFTSHLDKLAAKMNAQNIP